MTQEPALTHMSSTLGTHGAGISRDVQAVSLERVRGEIDRVDAAIVELLEHRGRLAEEARRCKEGLGRPLFDPAREAAIVRRAAERAASGDLDPEIVRDVFWRIVQLARFAQLDREEGS